MNLNTNYIKEFLDIEDPCLNFISCTRTTYRGKNVIMCVALAELNVCPNCESDNFIYNGFKTVTIPYVSANASKPVFIKVKKHGIFCKNCKNTVILPLTLSKSTATSLTLSSAKSYPGLPKTVL